MKRQSIRAITGVLLLSCASGWCGEAGKKEPESRRAIILPMERTAYFVGELVPIGLSNLMNAAEARFEAVNNDGRVLLYQGPFTPLVLDTSRLAPGDYALELNGVSQIPRFTLTSTQRISVASMQDEATPPNENEPLESPHWNDVVQTLRESGVSSLLHMAAVDTRRMRYLDTLARAGTTLLANPDTRPTSFFPTRNAPEELDSMTQRLLLGAQANGRYPNFAGYCYGWDTTGYPLGGRKGLMTYWGWGQNEQALRNYIDRIDHQMADLFRKRTGMEPVTDGEYISYLLSIKRPEFATMIDLPTRKWLREIAHHSKPMSDVDRTAFEKRLDAWSSYLMGMYGEVYGTFSNELRTLSPSFRNTASVQVDHCVVRNGQYFPEAYKPLDLRYQSTWNDQVGGPDYAYQWLLTAGLLDMGRGDKPTWLSNAISAAHHRAGYPGKFPRVAAHGLAYGVSGIGFALEAFSNLLGGMNRDANWSAIKGKSGGADVLAGREFLDRFAGLALNAHGDHGVGVLFSKSQFERQHVAMGFGQSHYQMLVALVRLGYTPRFVTEEELAVSVEDKTRAHEAVGSLKALIVINQSFPMDDTAMEGIRRFAQHGGKVFLDTTCTVDIPGAQRVAVDLPFSQPGKPHSWSAPNMVSGDNDPQMFARWYASNASNLAAALNTIGKGLLASAEGVHSAISLIQLNGGRDARYIIAVNDSFIATQADWYQVHEKLIPAGGSSGTLYDLTEEKQLGPLAPTECDLTATTVRVFGLLPRSIAALDIQATQQLKTGSDLILAARALDADRKVLEAVIPLHIALLRPDGKPHQTFYRTTGADGRLAMSIPVPMNAPSGTWQLAVRCQLDGTLVRLPIKITAQETPCTKALSGNVLVRGRNVIETLLQKGSKVVVPIFNSPNAPALRAAAVRLKDVLAARGVEVEIREQSTVIDYVLSYDPDEAVKAENAKADRGEAFGAIKRKTTNSNDWFCVLSGWRFGLPVVLIDLVGQQKDCPPAESLDAEGLLWPRVSNAYPGPGRAVVHGVQWAFAPRVNAAVIQAADEAGLIAGVEAFAALPEDILAPSVETARSRLWQQCHVGPLLDSPSTEGLTAEGLQTANEPAPFRIAFPGEKPPSAEEAKALAPQRPEPPVLAIPANVDPQKQLTPFYFDDNGRLIETATVPPLVPDLRFNDALRAIVDVKAPGKTKIVLTGVFRTSDRQPKSQAQWEDVLKLYKQMVPKERKPIEVDVQIAGKSIGKLAATKMETRKVPLEMGPSHGAKEVHTAEEEVATEISGEVDLPAGRQELMLIHHHIVDGLIEGLGIGMPPLPPAPKPEKKK